MSDLDERGDIAIALVIIYPFIAILTLILTIRHGFSRQAGWVSLLIFATCRIVGSILHIVAEKTNPPQIGLYIGAYTLEGIGLTPFLFCTKAFIGVIGKDLFGTPFLPFITQRSLRLLGLLLIGGAILLIVGASNSNDDSENTRNVASTFKRVGGILLAVAFIVLTILHLLLWQLHKELQKYQKTLLQGISCALPFLAVRVLYSTLSNFAPTTSSSSSIARFNSVSGSWQIYLSMSVIMELFAVSIYIFFGLRLPISEGAKSTTSGPGFDEEYPYGYGKTSRVSVDVSEGRSLYQNVTYPPQPAHGLGPNNHY